MKNKIKICFFLGSFQAGGAENLVLNIIKHLNKDKFITHLCVFTKNGALRSEFESLNVKIEEYPFNNFLKALLEYFRFVYFLYNQKINVIHVNLVGTFLFSMTASILAGIKIRILHWHNAYEISRTKKHKYVKYGSLLATKIIAISDFVRKRNCSIYKIDSSKVVTIYNSIDFESFKTEKISNNEIIIGTVGIMTKQKGYDILLKAFSIVVKKISNVKLEIIGKGELETEIKILIDKLNLNNKVILLGVMPNNLVKEKMKHWTAFVLASKWEGFGIVLIEAMTMELPVIASNVEAVPEIVINGETGLLFEKNNYYDLANKISLLLNDEHKIQEFAKKGKERVSRYFDISKTINKYEKLYYQ